MMTWSEEETAEEIKFLCRHATAQYFVTGAFRDELIPDCVSCIYAEPRRDTEADVYSKSGFYCSDLRMNFDISPEKVYWILRERYGF